jgi:monofunctional glycosyltransferase
MATSPSHKNNIAKFFTFRKLKFVIVFLLVQPFYAAYCIFFFPPITITQFLAMRENDRDYYRAQVPLKQVSHYILLALIASEDSNFLKHDGFEWQSMWDSITSGKGGGSTISQQTAKNVFLWQNRDPIRKGLELYSTWLIEKIWKKRRILEIYVNTIEFERGVYGIEAAAQRYFNKPAADLTRKEAATIAACLPSPKGCLSDRRNPPESLRKRRIKILEGMDYLENRLPAAVKNWFD